MYVCSLWSFLFCWSIPRDSSRDLQLIFITGRRNLGLTSRCKIIFRSSSPINTALLQRLSSIFKKTTKANSKCLQKTRVPYLWKSGQVQEGELQIFTLYFALPEALLTTLKILFAGFKEDTVLILKEFSSFFALPSRAEKRLVSLCFLFGGLHSLSSTSFSTAFLGARLSEIPKCRISFRIVMRLIRLFSLVLPCF